VVNCNPRQKNRNELALQLAKENPHLIPRLRVGRHTVQGRSARGGLV
jgi:hypothetical protein